MLQRVLLPWPLALGLVASVAAFGQHGGPQGNSNLSPIAPFHMPQSIGLSSQSIGLSAPSIGLSPHSIPVAKPPAERRSRHKENRHEPLLPYSFVGAPLFLPPVDQTAPTEAAPPEDGSDQSTLSDQIKQLSQQLHDLQDQLARNSAPAAEQENTDEPAPAPAPAITVVLKSGQSFQTQNYAVIGGTFWDLSSEPARKIAVTTIDPNASQKATEANGAEFPVIRSTR